MLGPFPPPVHGMANVNQAVHRALSSRGGTPPVVLDIGSATIRRSIKGSLVKLARLSGALLRLVALLALRRSDRLYLSLSGGPGQLGELPFVLLGRVARVGLFLHHHSFAYCDRRSTLTAALIRLAGPDAVHFVLCERMGSLLRRRYGERTRTVVISNSAFSHFPGPATAIRRLRPRTVGYLSNVSREKGIDRFLEVARRLLPEHPELRFVIAGPIPDPAVREEVLAAAGSLEGLDYLGPVYDDDKRSFLERVDVLLFPTDYRDEAEPLTILEALTYGIPVIARSKGCIGDLVPAEGGLAVDPSADFAAAAIDQLTRWLADETAFRAASGRSVDHVAGLAVSTAANLRAFLACLGAGPGVLPELEQGQHRRQQDDPPRGP